MIKNYFKIALRNIKRNYTFSILNISGMAIGMAGALLLLLWVQYEISWDRFHKNGDRLYRVLVNHTYNDGRLVQEAFTPVPLAAALKEEYPEIIRSSRYLKYKMALPKGDELINEEISFVDKDFFKMFNIEFIRGDRNSALTGPHDLIITEEIAHKYFADEDPVGKTLISMGTVLTITGVAKSFPHNSLVQFGLLLPFEFLTEPESQVKLINDWNHVSGPSFIELDKGADNKLVEDKIKGIIERNRKDINAEIFLQNIKKIHLYSAGKYAGESFYLGSINYIRLASLVAFLILTIACINFMNLSTAQSSGRAKEIGVRKVGGANKGKIIFQFLGESLLIVFVAHVIAMILVELLLPGFNNIMYHGNTKVEVNYQSVGLYVGLITVVLFCGLLAGSYPAFYLSSLKPLDTIKGVINKNPGNARFRRILVISQFTLSFLFIICTLIVRSQINYIQNKNVGLNIDNIGYFGFTNGIQRETLKNELSNNPDIESVTVTGQYVLNNWSTASGVNWKGKKEGEDVSFSVLNADKDYAKTFQLELKEGSFLSTNEFSTDTTVIVVNEKAAEIMGFKNPIGEVISDRNGLKFSIIGVVRDFHFKSLRSAIEPLVITPIPPSTPGGICYIRMKPDHISSIVNYIRNFLKSYNLDNTLDFGFLKDDYNSIYIIEQTAGVFLGYLTFLAIIISCLGLIGLSAFMTVRRTKEIGIRKTHGAKPIEIFSMLSKEYIGLVTISFIIACPFAWFATNMWLQSYAYRIKMSWWLFAVAWVIVMVITMLTVGFQSYRAASKNPVEALRYE
ncbi:MAG: ABC transporter permease [Bacteroidia bacterium]|nr:ABC transporter permease [Bacteroidia bacterium]